MAQLRPTDLKASLARGLAPVYLVAGDEPLLLEEALDAIRAAARSAGCEEREVLHADGSFDWGRLAGSGASLSLFSQRRLLELRLPASRPGVDGAKALAQWCAAPPDDVVLVVAAGRLDSRARSSAWVKALARAGHFLYAWPVEGAELPRWITARAAAAGLRLDRDAAALLAARSEGNLLAAAQEAEKLELIHGSGPVDAQAMRSAVASSARFDVFDLPAAARSGDAARVLRVARGLREEGEAPQLLLWALARDIRVLAELQAAHARQSGPDAVFRRHRVPKPQQGELWRTATRTRGGAWEAVLARAARVDATLKGAGPGRPWDELIQLAATMAQTAAGR